MTELANEDDFTHYFNACLRLRAENERLNMELRAEKQDHGAVVAGLQGEIKRLEEQLATARELRDFDRDDLKAARVSIVALDTEVERIKTLADTRHLMLGQLRAQFDDMVRQRDRALDQLSEVEDRLIKDNEQLIAALKLFVGCKYPVAVQINPRGYDWLPEKSLDHALSVALLALGEMK